jgi:hypothetical protein
MLKFLTSLSFLYALVITILVLYGLYYYREFARSARQRKRFPAVFAVIGLACLGFLWINIHSPLGLKTFTNLDHHFIRHDGFVVNGGIELGRSDTVNFDNNAYNSFIFSKKEAAVVVNSTYSEEPFYTIENGKYRILSKSFPASGHQLSISADQISATLKMISNDEFQIEIDNNIFTVKKEIKKGISLWNLFRDESSFISSDYYNNTALHTSLKLIFLVHNDYQGETGGLDYFISGRLFSSGTSIIYDQKQIRPGDLAFESVLPDAAHFAWGIGFLSNNRSQFKLKTGVADSFTLLMRYPVSYPLTEQDREDWSAGSVSKFLVSDPADMINMPSVFEEGFIFSFFGKGDAENFAPVLLTQQKDAGNKDLQIKAQLLDRPTSIPIDGNKWLLPARKAGINWIFSANDTSQWDFGTFQLSAGTWKMLIFGSLIIFFGIVLITSMFSSASSLSWVWQIFSVITLTLLTTRFFLYWRYKTFPPYEGMDLPSQQQLNSVWNFAVILLATIILAIIFGSPLFKSLFARLRGNRFGANNIDAGSSNYERLASRVSQTYLVKRFGPKLVFFGTWAFILFAAAGFAAFRNFDPGTCRHLAIFLVISYFFFVYTSYRHSPLVVSSTESWWKIHTGNTIELVINNPVKVLLSISLLATFVFIDIGFAIVFLNFLFFNEAFLCINYSIAGLSSGSRKNASLYGILGATYLFAFVFNLLFAPYIFSAMLHMSQVLYLGVYLGFSLLLAYNLVRIIGQGNGRKRWVTGFGLGLGIFMMALFFFPKQRVLDKAAMTRYRIDVLTMPVEKAIESAYAEGKSYTPVIRAAQNQWFINTLIYEKNNPGVKSAGFQLIPHSPQNKGAKYNAQATDLVASRFFMAEHGSWSILFYMLLLILPTIMLASFYRLYPDFTNRTNSAYPVITAGFSIMNFLLITALLVILAATGRYIFFGQDMPFGSILSKQSILFPSILIVSTVLLFGKIPLQYYANRRKLIPGLIIFFVLAGLLFFVKPVFNKNKDFNVAELANNMDLQVTQYLQPVLDHFDTSRATRKLTMARKDKLFTDSLRRLFETGAMTSEGSFFGKEAEAYTKTDFSGHLDQNRLIYLDLYSGKPELAVNENYFRIEPPPHLQQSWKGNVFGDSTNYNLSLLNCGDGSVITKRLSSLTNQPRSLLCEDIELNFISADEKNNYKQLQLVNKGSASLEIKYESRKHVLSPGEAMVLSNPSRLLIGKDNEERLLKVEPDAFMRNYYVNGSRFYVYPLGNRFVWARNFAEGIASDRTNTRQKSNAVISLDLGLMDSLSGRIQSMMNNDTAYTNGAEFGICVADGEGRLIAMADHVKGLSRPDPNDKVGFNKTITGDNGYISQSRLRKQIGNINLLRMNPGPGSTLKPIIFSAISSQINIDWDAFASSGFVEKQEYFGGEKVAEYDFEKDNGQINNISDYLKYSDNYYHANVLLLGSYPKQKIDNLLSTSFKASNPGTGVHWPNFQYNNKQYWLDGFSNWPGYANREVNFAMDNSFTSIGLFSNYGISTRIGNSRPDMFNSGYDSMLLGNSYKKSGFIMPEFSLFDQEGTQVNHKIAYDVFANCFRGHVKGSSQVMIPPVKMVEAFGKMVSQDRGYFLTLNPFPLRRDIQSFAVDNTIAYNSYLSLMRDGVFKGMEEALYRGTAAGLGQLLEKGSKYFYYAKTGTTGDNAAKTKSKLMVVIISEKDIKDPGFNFRNNKFYTIYLTMQNGPAKQNEKFQKEVIDIIQQSTAFNRYMGK